MKDQDLGNLCCGLHRSLDSSGGRGCWLQASLRDSPPIVQWAVVVRLRRGRSRRARRGSSGGRRRHGGSRREAEAESEVWRRQKDGREATGVSLTAC